MTERLYYTDSYRTTFDARVVRIDRQTGHDVAILDRTAFYPTSGGQPHDTGRLGDAAVVEVVETSDGLIAHRLDRPLEAGAAVTGSIDWDRRFDHMQQHTGQHLLSAAFARLLEARTVAFHLGPQRSTIDLDVAASLESCRRAEDEANRIVWSDRPLSVRFTSAREAATLPLRRESARTGRLRLVEVEGFDLSACGGTHVSRTGEVGVIAILGAERHKRGTRVEFVCGRRALELLRLLGDAVAQAVRRLSVLPAELPGAIDRLQADCRSAARLRKSLQSRLAEFDAAALVVRATGPAGCRMVVEALEEYDAAGLKAVATAIGRHAGHVAVLLSARAPVLVAVSCPGDGPVDARAIVRALIERFGGRGGGQRALAQAGGLEATPDEVAARARAAVAEASGNPAGGS